MRPAGRFFSFFLNTLISQIFNFSFFATMPIIAKAKCYQNLTYQRYPTKYRGPFKWYVELESGIFSWQRIGCFTGLRR